MTKIKDLNTSVYITVGFPGTYKWAGGMSYYRDGDTDKTDIHFSVPGGDNSDFKDFHISKPYGGRNAHIWYRNGNFNSVDVGGMPSAEKAQWDTWWAANRAKCNAAATAFWTAAQPG